MEDTKLENKPNLDEKVMAIYASIVFDSYTVLTY